MPYVELSTPDYVVAGFLSFLFSRPGAFPEQPLLSHFHVAVLYIFTGNYLDFLAKNRDFI